MASLPEPNRRSQGALVPLDYEFEGHRVRCGGTRDRPWFVAQDACDVLGIQNARDALKNFPGDEKGVEDIYTPGGKQKVIVLYESGLYRLIFRSNKSGAEEFRRWVFHEVLPSIRKTGEYRTKERQRYRRLGKDGEWIDTREKGIESRVSFTGILQQHGVTPPYGFARCTDAINRPILGSTAKRTKERLCLPTKARLRDHLDLGALLAIGLAEYHAGEKIKSVNAQGNQECERVSGVAAFHVAQAVKQIQGH